MSLDSKVIWSEGMFLNPHHFQQQERYFERYVNEKCTAYGGYGWGIHQFNFDKELLKLGKISINSANGVFPDGTPFSFPGQSEAPDVYAVPENTSNQLLYLAMPVRRLGAIDVLAKSDSQGLARYYLDKQAIRDVSVIGSDSIDIDVGQPRFRILLETDDRSGYACIPLMRINETREDKNVLLDDEFIPTCLDINASPKLSGFLTELVGLIHHRGEAIAGRLADTKRGGTAEVADYMMLQMINRLEPLTIHLANVKGLHPVQLFQEVIQIAGEFATFVSDNKRPPQLPLYLHDDLQATFAPVMGSMRQSLSMVYEQSAIALPLVEKKYGIRVAQITDRTLLASAAFIIAVRADVAENTIRTQFPAQIKIGPVERIRQLVNAAMPGIAIKPLSTVPRQIPYRAGYSYFEMERGSDFWKELTHSGGFALHIGGDFPGLEIELWSIRQ